MYYKVEYLKENTLNKGTQTTLLEIQKRCKKLTDDQLEDVLQFLIELEGKKELASGKLNVGVDFDGTLCYQPDKWEGDLVIKGKPIAGSLQFLENLCRDDEIKVYILSSRCKNKRFKNVFFEWLSRYNFDEDLAKKISVVQAKPPLHIYIDDRSYCFNGKNYPTVKEIKEFLPWYKPRSLNEGK